MYKIFINPTNSQEQVGREDSDRNFLAIRRLRGFRGLLLVRVVLEVPFVLKEITIASTI